MVCAQDVGKSIPMGSHGNEEHVVGNWGRAIFVAVARNLADLCSLLNVEPVSNEMRYLTEAISKQRMEDIA